MTKPSIIGRGIVVEAVNRKARRKEMRHAKKQKQRHHSSNTRDGKEVPPPSIISQDEDTNVAARSINSKKKTMINDNVDSNQRSNKRVKFSNTLEGKPSVKNRDNDDDEGEDDSSHHHQQQQQQQKKTKRSNAKRYYEHLDEETALALLRDDKEIEFLESNLGITKFKKKELNREYANNEGFGSDFGDFLMDLDNLVDRCVGGGGGFDDNNEDRNSSSEPLGSSNDDDESNAGQANMNKIESKNSDVGSYDNSEDDDDDDLSIAEEGGVINENYDDDEDSYTNIDEETAIALRNDDAEISALEEKLGLSSATNSSKAKKKLRKEYASAFSGYGEDFADFLDELDTLGQKTGMRRGGGGGDKEALLSCDDDDDGNDDDGDDNSDDGSNNGSDFSDSESGEDALLENSSDHDVALTYRPIAGEDIYGNTIGPSRNNSSKPSKYVPPHLRNRSSHQDDTTTTIAAAAADPEIMIQIQRQINNALNRLSDQTLESVSKSIASVYSSFAFRDVNDCLWKNIQISCIPSHMIMSGLIPLYIGAMAGVHWLAGDGSQIGGCLVEWSVTNLFDSLIKIRKARDDDGTNEVDELDHDVINKEAANCILIVCYLYNYGVIHCTLIYDLVRDFIRNFMEIDVEGLLVILSHCGQQLRSDDPTALREIVLMVKDRAKTAEDSRHDITNIADSSRIQYMVDSITELKNNKPRKQDAVIREKANALKKIVGRIKNSTSQSLVGQKNGSCLRVTLQDVLDAELKGRWWMVGASWTGNQDRDLLWGTEDEQNNEHSVTTDTSRTNLSSSKNGSHRNEDSLLALASSQRMNTDTRRSIFCVVMGSTDCDDAFEKLVRGGMLKPKVERDVIRVLIHCCGEEKAYNPFYAYLATRCCEYQAKSRFTLMLSFWDAFKQFDTFTARKVANLAKLLAHFVSADNKYTNIGVLKRIDFSPTDMSEMAILFLTIFMTTIFETCDVASTNKIFSHDTTATDASGARKSKQVDSESDDNDDDVDAAAKSGKMKKEDLSELKENLSIFLLQYLKSSPKNIEGSKFHSHFLAAMETCEKTNANS